MKELGVYDDSLIIIISDHGIHDGVDGISFPKASTPLFLIKEQNINRNEICLNNSPIYHEDIIPTILVNCGLYYEGDEKIIGNSIYDFKEGDLRERIWYDRDFNSDSILAFSYTGNTEDLEFQVETNNFRKINR